MTEVERTELIAEIKELERELDRKRARLSYLKRVESADHSVRRTKDEWRAEFEDLVEQIGAKSSGGDAVQEVRKMRDRE